MGIKLCFIIAAIVACNGINGWGCFLFIFSIFSSYAVYQYREDAKQAELKSSELSSKVEYLNQQAIKNNEVIAKNATTKLEVENESIKQQEQINALVKNNQCANELVPSDVSIKLYNHAKAIRQSTSASKSN